MVEQRQIGERQRVAGNEAFRTGQFSEALRCYQVRQAACLESSFAFCYTPYAVVVLV